MKAFSDKNWLKFDMNFVLGFTRRHDTIRQLDETKLSKVGIKFPSGMVLVLVTAFHKRMWFYLCV